MIVPVMRRSLGIALVLAAVACGVTSDAPARPSPTSVVRTSSPLPARTPTPRPSVPASLPATPSESATPAVRPSGAIHYVAIGASDTVGVGSLDPANGSWPSRLAALLPLGATYRNLGVSGSLTAQAQREQLPVALAEQPTIVTIWLAVNDVNAQVAPGVYGTSLLEMVDALVRGTPARIFIGNVPDLRAVPVYSAIDPQVLLALIGSYNAQVAAVAAKHAGRVVVVDLFGGSAELTTTSTISADGFHPSDTGYAMIAQRFADALRRSGIALRTP